MLVSCLSLLRYEQVDRSGAGRCGVLTGDVQDPEGLPVAVGSGLGMLGSGEGGEGGRGGRRVGLAAGPAGGTLRPAGLDDGLPGRVQGPQQAGAVGAAALHGPDQPRAR